MGKILDWISNKLTELSIAQISGYGYSEEDEELIRKWENMTHHISKGRRKLIVSKMLESHVTHYAESVVKKKVIEEEHKRTKTDRIMEFFSTNG